MKIRLRMNGKINLRLVCLCLSLFSFSQLQCSDSGLTPSPSSFTPRTRLGKIIATQIQEQTALWNIPLRPEKESTALHNKTDEKYILSSISLTMAPQVSVAIPAIIKIRITPIIDISWERSAH